jgi:hypothetical protein
MLVSMHDILSYVALGRLRSQLARNCYSWLKLVWLEPNVLVFWCLDMI